MKEKSLRTLLGDYLPMNCLTPDIPALRGCQKTGKIGPNGRKTELIYGGWSQKSLLKMTVAMRPTFDKIPQVHLAK